MDEIGRGWNLLIDFVSFVFICWIKFILWYVLENDIDL